MIKRRAFTSLEMIICLGIVAILLCITGPQIGRSNQKMAEERFFQSFRQEWQSAQVRSRVQGKYTAIKYSESNHAVSFAYGHNLCDWVNLPNSLQVKNFPNKMVMENNGYVKPTTITLYSTVEHCEYQIVVQMARGEYDVKKSTRVRDGG